MRYRLTPLFSFLILWLTNLCVANLQAQNTYEACQTFPTVNPNDKLLFDNNTVPRVDILLDPDDFNTILTQTLNTVDYPATFVFTNGNVVDTIENVGFRQRGNTSLSAAKKSFKISFNSYETGGKYRGVEKLNLNGHHNDPSIIRAKLAWDLFSSMGVAAARVNHVAFYINGAYRGLYANVEHIDDAFVKKRFGNDLGNLYKCTYPADLNYLGDNPDDYKLVAWGKRVYELKNNEDVDDYTSLADFIIALNQTPSGEFAETISRLFNVDSYLRAVAVDVYTSNWDAYSVNKNNFYLFHNTTTGKIEYIPYDLDNTFGIDWFDVDWATTDIYEWDNPSESRPMYQRIMSEPIFKNRFSFYLNELMQNCGHPDYLFPKMDSIATLINPHVEADVFRTLDYGFSVADFEASFDEAWGIHVSYGIKEYLDLRRADALEQLELNNIIPVIHHPTHQPLAPRTEESITISTRIFDDESIASATLYYRFNGGMFETTSLLDDGTNGDILANDQIYTATIIAPDEVGLVEYYIESTDNTDLQNREPFVAGWHEIMITEAPQLFINEFMASNESSFADEAGEFDDWIEIYNASNEAIYLGDKYLTDDLNNPDKWAFPDISIEPNSFLLVWADEDEEQGDLHANFKLKKSGETIGIFDNNLLPIHTIAFANANTDQTKGLYPDGSGIVQDLSNPTPAYSNVAVGLFHNSQQVQGIQIGKAFPNPFKENVEQSLTLAQAQTIRVQVVDITGRLVQTLRNEQLSSGVHHISWDGINRHHQASTNGLYWLQTQVLQHGTWININFTPIIQY